jgi:hypothetical protein
MTTQGLKALHGKPMNIPFIPAGKITSGALNVLLLLLLFPLPLVLENQAQGLAQTRQALYL